jgi:hypothetical protein
MLTLTALLAACGPSTESDAPSTPWSYEPVADRDPGLAPADIEAAITTWLPELRRVRVDPLFEAWDIVTAHADEACPVQEVYDYGASRSSAWYTEGCSAGDGAAFQGYAQRASETGVDENGWTVQNEYVYAVAAAVTPEGWAWQGSGYAAFAYGELDHPDEPEPYLERYTQHFIGGDFTWDGPSAAGTWLGSPLRMTGGWGSYEVPGLGGNMVLDGTLSGDLGELTALAASGVSTLTPAWRPCDTLEPTGIISLRDADGGWYDAVFNGPVEGEPTPDQCDGCGELWFEGELVGQVCPDFSALLDGVGAAL